MRKNQNFFKIQFKPKLKPVGFVDNALSFKIFEKTIVFSFDSKYVISLFFVVLFGGAEYTQVQKD